MIPIKKLSKERGFSIERWNYTVNNSRINILQDFFLIFCVFFCKKARFFLFLEEKIHNLNKNFFLTKNNVISQFFNSENWN